MNDQEFHAPTRLVLGAGARRSIRAEMDALRTTRATVVCTRRFAATPIYSEFVDALGDAITATYADVTPQSNLREVDAIKTLLVESESDVVVAIGGGSVLGVAKCAVAAAAEGKPLEDIAWSYQPQVGTVSIPRLKRPKVPIVAVPTTAGSASETNQFGSVKDEATSEKVRVRAGDLAPRVAVLDPELTVSLDVATTIGTGANAFAHCVEILYSRQANPISSALSLEAARLIVENLPLCVKEPDDLAARGSMQLAAAMSGMALNNAMVCLHHGLCHPLGNICGVPHGVANYIMLPHSLRFNAGFADPAMARLGEALGVTGARAGEVEQRARSTTQYILDWVRALDGPQRLRDTGCVAATDLAALAQSAFHDTCMYYNPRRVESPVELQEIYAAAW